MRKGKYTFKKFTTNLKRAWRKLKYLDKTQLNYYIVTSFIGIFCLFTGTTYSMFTVSKYLSAATITIAKLNYTLTSSTSGYSNGTISVAAGATVYVDLNLKSLNSINTKYALNYSTSSSSTVKVYYSQNLRNNMDGEIGTNGSSIDMRIVIVNSGTSAATVTLSVAGGYLQNTLYSNIANGYYEQDILVRTVLVDENFANATAASSFPAKTDNYAYYKTECSETADPVWDYDSWSLNLNNLSKQISCDVYFKKMTNDIEIYFMLQDKNGENGAITTTAPTSGYTFQKATCSTGATATWNTSTNKLDVSGITDKTMCIGYFNKNS